jgi:flagellar biosynthesis protein
MERPLPRRPDVDLAIALRYDPAAGEPPRIAAKGRARVAAQIVRLAEQHGVAVLRDPNLAALLATLELESPIPIAAFAAVAAILARLHRADRNTQTGEA